MFRFPKSIFSVTTGIICPTKFSIKNFFLEENFFENLWFPPTHQIRDSPKIPKSALYTGSARSSNCNFSALTRSFSAMKSQSKKLHLYTSVQQKKSLNFSLHENRELIVQRMPKKPFPFDCSRYSNSCFLKTINFISSIRVEIRNFVIENFFMGK